MDFTTVFHS